MKIRVLELWGFCLLIQLNGTSPGRSSWEINEKSRPAHWMWGLTRFFTLNEKKSFKRYKVYLSLAILQFHLFKLINETWLMSSSSQSWKTWYSLKITRFKDHIVKKTTTLYHLTYSLIKQTFTYCIIWKAVKRDHVKKEEQRT